MSLITVQSLRASLELGTSLEQAGRKEARAKAKKEKNTEENISLED